MEGNRSSSGGKAPGGRGAPADRTEHGKTLLLVDDEPHVAQGLRRVLHPDGYRILVAAGAEEALAILAREPVDVVVSDQRMPGMKGTELLATVTKRYPHTVRMILSGAADVEEVARAMRSGAIYKFLTKPIHPALLRANVEEAFARAAASRTAGVSAAAADMDQDIGVESRQDLERIFADLLARSRNDGEAVCLLMLKVDHYDHVVGSFGYALARQFLRTVAEELKRAFPGPYYLGHASPGVFLLLTTAGRPADRIAYMDHELDLVFAGPMKVGGQSLTVTVTVGATATSDGAVSFDEVVDQAHAAMMIGSARGGSTLQLFAPQLVGAFRGQLELESDLRQAVAARSFELHYQPQVNWSSGRVVGVEALLRWRHPKRGFVSPLDFIPLAERIGAINELGGWVLESAVEQLRTWEAANVAPGELAINVSALQLRDLGLVDKVYEVVRRQGLITSRLVLELTESAAIEQQRSISECLDALHGVGVTLAVDDFGTGYANMANLTRFPFGKLKLDRSLLRQARDDRGRRLYSSVVTMAQELGLSTVAEGVETAEDLDIVRAAGCSTVQGYLYSRAVDADRISRLLATGFPPHVA